MVCPVDADGGATRMSETGRPSRSLPPPSGAPAAASASGTGSRERDEAGVLPISDARSAGVPEIAIINHPLPRNECSKNRELRRFPNPGIIRTPDTLLGHCLESSPLGRRPTLETSIRKAPSPYPVRVRSGGALSHAKRFDPVRRWLRAPSATSRLDRPAAQGRRDGVPDSSRASRRGTLRSEPLTLGTPRTGNGRGD